MNLADVEKSVFRKLISNPLVMVKYIAKVSPDDFTTPIIRNVMGAFAANASATCNYIPGKPFFEILLRDRYHSAAELDQVANVLTGIAGNPTDTKDLDMLVRELKANRMCRELAQVVQKNLPSIKPESIEEAYESLLKDLLHLPLKAASGISSNTLREVHDELDARVLEYMNPSVPRIATGIRAFDAVMGGVAPGEFVILTSGTGGGKSNMLLWWAEQFVERGYNSLYVTMEMSYEQNLNRYHAIQTGFDTIDISHKRIPENRKHVYFEKLIAANKDKTVRAAFLRECETIANRADPHNALSLAKKYANRKSKLFILDIAGCTPSRVEQEVQRLSMDNKIDCVFVDFINYMDPDFHNKDRVRELVSISNGLKKVGRKTKTIMFSACQLDTTTLKNTQDEELSTNNVKYSKGIAEDGDWVIAWNRTAEDNLRKQIRLQMIKTRGSPRCQALIEFDFGTMQAIDLGFVQGSFIPYGYMPDGRKIDEVMSEPTQETLSMSSESPSGALPRLPELGDPNRDAVIKERVAALGEKFRAMSIKEVKNDEAIEELPGNIL